MNLIVSRAIPTTSDTIAAAASLLGTCPSPGIMPYSTGTPHVGARRDSPSHPHLNPPCPAIVHSRRPFIRSFRALLIIRLPVNPHHAADRIHRHQQPRLNHLQLSAADADLAPHLFL